MRQLIDKIIKSDNLFQSTHSLRSATIYVLEYAGDNKVSIHALLAECDEGRAEERPEAGRFNPRTPCGVRRGSAGTLNQIYGFNPRTPCGVRLGGTQGPQWGNSFNPRTPCGVRQG